MKSYYEFGGFYQGIHSDLIDDYIKSYEIKDPDYLTIHTEYAKQLLTKFNEKFKISMKFVSIWSPKEYNYRTDAIEINITEKDLKSLHKFIDSNDLNEELDEALKQATTHRPGFIPLYSIKELKKKENREIYITILLSVLEELLLEENELGFCIEDFCEY